MVLSAVMPIRSPCRRDPMPRRWPRFLAAPGALADHFPLVLSYGGENVDRQLVGMGDINGNKFDAAFHKHGNEGQVTGQAVELGDDKALPSAFCRPRAPSPAPGGQTACRSRPR